jgi:hypothetical protein
VGGEDSSLFPFVCAERERKREREECVREVYVTA